MGPTISASSIHDGHRIARRRITARLGQRAWHLRTILRPEILTIPRPHGPSLPPHHPLAASSCHMSCRGPPHQASRLHPHRVLSPSPTLYSLLLGGHPYWGVLDRVGLAVAATAPQGEAAAAGGLRYLAYFSSVGCAGVGGRDDGDVERFADSDVAFGCSGNDGLCGVPGRGWLRCWSSSWLRVNCARCAFLLIPRSR